MEKQLLECGHRQPVKQGAGATWCPICNEMAIVIDEAAGNSFERQPISR